MSLIKKCIFYTVIVFITISCKSTAQQQYVTRVQSLLKEKANIYLTKEEIELRRYDSDQVMGDWSEYYIINIPDSSHAKILSIVKQDTSWKEIQNGYQLSIFIEDTDKLGYIDYGFVFSKAENSLSIQVTKE